MLGKPEQLAASGSFLRMILVAVLLLASGWQGQVFASTDPAIILSPTNQMVAIGGTIALSVSATGTAPLSYQWFLNGGRILGATNSTLTLTNAGITNAGIYYAAVTNTVGLCLSTPVNVTVGTPQLLAWGQNDYGKLGDGTTNNQSLPEFVAGNVMGGAVGLNHSLFLKSDGTLWAVGQNSGGQLGDSTTNNQMNLVAVAGGTNVVAVAAGYVHSLFLKSDGSLWAMGMNNYGQIGDGTTTQRHSPILVTTNVVAIGAGYLHSLFLKQDGTVWAMGNNSSGQLGDGTTTHRHAPVAVASNVVAIAAGYTHSLFLKSDSTVWATGDNFYGNLGDGTTTQQTNPIAVASNVVAVVAGGYHSLFLKEDSTLWGTGDNNLGQLGDGTTINRSNAVLIASNVAAAAGGIYYSLYIKSDGTLLAMGRNKYGQLGDGTLNDRHSPVPIPGLLPACIMTGSSASHTFAVVAPMPPASLSLPATQTVTAGSNVTLVITASGLAPMSFQWQFNGSAISGATATNYSLTPATMANAGNYTVVISNVFGSVTSSAAILAMTPALATVTLANTNQTYDGTTKAVTVTTAPAGLPVTVTYNNSSNLPVNAGVYTVSAIISDSNYTGSATGFLTVNQSAATVNLSSLLQLYDGTARVVTTTTVPGGLPVSLTYNGGTTAPTNTGIFVVTGTLSDPNYTGTATKLLGVATAGTPLTWGYGANGELGNNATTNSLTPVAVATNGALAGKTIVGIAGGEAHNLALTADGQVFAWGFGSDGELGEGATTNSRTPVPVLMSGALAGKTVIALGAGASHCLALTTDGQLFAWGKNQYGQLGNNSTNNSLVPVAVDMSGGLAGKLIVGLAVGSSHNLVWTDDGQAFAWGWNNHGQLGNSTTNSALVPGPVNISGLLASKSVIRLAAGDVHSLALTADGQIFSWGWNGNGQLGNASQGVDALVPTAVTTNGVLAGKKVNALAAGVYHSLALTADGQVFSWGGNYNGQLGNNTTTESHVPMAVATNGVLAGKTVVAISTGYGHSRAVTSEGQLFAWGKNQYGQLGNLSTTDSLIPIAVTTNGLMLGKTVTTVVSGVKANNTLALVVRLPNVAPEAINQVIALPKNTITNLVLNGTDVYGDTLTYAILTGPTNGNLGTLTATNGTVTYTPANNFHGTDGFTFAVSDGSLTATGQVVLTIGIVQVDLHSSLNPGGYKAAIRYTASVLPTNASGTVQFAINGLVFDSAPLTNGVAGSTLSTLPRGTNLVVAQFVGNESYADATNVLTQVITNHPPITGAFTFPVTNGVALKLKISDLLAAVTDADGDAVSFASISASTNGITLPTNSTYIVYHNTNGVNDQFSYTVLDGQGGVATGLVHIAAARAPFLGQPGGLIIVHDGMNALTFHGMPGYTYIIQRTTDLGNWVDIATNTAAPSGIFQANDHFTDLSGPPASAFYRLKWVP